MGEKASETVSDTHADCVQEDDKAADDNDDEVEQSLLQSSSTTIEMQEASDDVGDSGHDMSEDKAAIEGACDDDLPIDSGYAWIILAGCYLNTFLLVGYGRGIALLFVEYIRVFEASVSATTLFMGVIVGAYSIGALISMNLVLTVLGIRKTVLCGATLSVIGMVTAIFAPNLTFLICTHSIITGVGHSMILGPGLVIIGQYFKKRRGLAMTGSLSAVSLAGIAFPPLVRFLLDTYALRGTMVILTGLTMNLWVGGLLMRPLESFRNPRSKGSGSADKDGTEQIQQLIVSQEDLSVLKIETMLPDNSHKDGVNGIIVNLTMEDLKNQNNNKSETVNTGIKTSVHEEENLLYQRKKKEKANKHISIHLKRVTTLLDFSLFKQKTFRYIITLCPFAIFVALIGGYLPALADEMGVSQSDAALLLTIMFSLDFFSRLCVGSIVDRGFIKVNNMMALGLLVTGTATHFTRFYTSFSMLVGFAVVAGIFGSFYMCLLPVAISQFMGISNMAKAFGFVTFFQGVSGFVGHPIIGVIRDMTGTYTMCFHCIGAVTYIGAILLLLAPLFIPLKAQEEVKT